MEAAQRQVNQTKSEQRKHELSETVLEFLDHVASILAEEYVTLIKNLEKKEGNHEKY